VSAKREHLFRGKMLRLEPGDLPASIQRFQQSLLAQAGFTSPAFLLFFGVKINDKINTLEVSRETNLHHLGKSQ
jgi:hypothetical protein